MAIGLGTAMPNASLDAFMHREGYESRSRSYRPVTGCWCGSDDLAPVERGHESYQHYQVCRSCGCLLLKEVLAEEHLGELYGARYFREHQLAIGLPAYHQRYENDVHDRIPVWIRILRQHVPEGRVLEVGCSHGRFLKELAELGYDVLGLELDAQIAQWTRQKTGLDIRAERLEQQDGERFDAVFASDVIEHVYDPRSFVADAVRVLKPYGLAFFQTVVFDRWQNCPVGMLRPLYHTVLYSRKSLASLAPANGQMLSLIPSVFGCHMLVVQRNR
jgi:SAM-dependent methyltransferase